METFARLSLVNCRRLITAPMLDRWELTESSAVMMALSAEPELVVLVIDWPEMVERTPVEDVLMSGNVIEMVCPELAPT